MNVIVVLSDVGEGRGGRGGNYSPDIILEGQSYTFAPSNKINNHRQCKHV